MSKPKTQKIAARLPAELVAALESFAADNFTTFSDALRRAAVAGLKASDELAEFAEDYSAAKRQAFGAPMEWDC
jgi:hypothetical protein